MVIVITVIIIIIIVIIIIYIFIIFLPFLLASRSFHCIYNNNNDNDNNNRKMINIIEKINGKTLVLSRTFVFFRSQTCIKRSPEWRGDRLVQVDRLIQVPWNRVVIKKNEK